MNCEMIVRAQLKNCQEFVKYGGRQTLRAVKRFSISMANYNVRAIANTDIMTQRSIPDSLNHDARLKIAQT